MKTIHREIIKFELVNSPLSPDEFLKKVMKDAAGSGGKVINIRTEENIDRNITHCYIDVEYSRNPWYWLLRQLQFVSLHLTQLCPLIRNLIVRFNLWRSGWKHK